MLYEFDKKRLLSNIAFLLEESGKKIGELEKAVGVSIGYISRLSKEENSKPGIDFIVGVAEALKINIDTLLKSNLSELPSTVSYLLDFLHKLETDTLSDKLDWEKEPQSALNKYINGIYGDVSDSTIKHPMLSFEVFVTIDDNGRGEQQEGIVFNSHTFEENTAVSGDWFKLRLKNNYYLYLANIRKGVYNVKETDVFAKEVWVLTPNLEKKYICSTKEDKTLAAVINRLYTVIAERMKLPKMEKELVDTIDAFMKDDWVDDPPPQVLFDEEIPF